MSFKYSNIILSKEECNFISDYILENEEYVKSLGPDVYPGTSPNSLSGRHTIFNWLNTDIGDILIPKLENIFDELGLKYPISVNCWANTFRQGEGIKPHFHSLKDYILCSHIFISGPTNIGTRYFEDGPDNKDNKMENVPGEIILFTPDLWHSVDNNITDEVRITMAMDIFPGQYKEDTKRYYVMEEI